MVEFILEISDNAKLEANNQNRKVAGVILAAGSSSRFGSPKQLAQIGQTNLIQQAQHVLGGTSVEETCVILGCNIQLIENYVDSKMSLINNITWGEGIASSIRYATKFAQEKNATHLLMMVCDQPFVTTQLLQKILVTSEKNANSIVACKYKDTSGIQAIFPVSYYDALLNLQGDRGAKAIINQSKGSIFLNFENGEIDIDKPHDLEYALTIKRSD